MTRRDRIAVTLALGSLFFLWLLSLPVGHEPSWQEALLVAAFVLGFAACTLPSFPHERRRR